MNELIKINDENMVDGRSLHEFLHVKTPYTIWFERMCEYGFTEETDYWTANKNVIRADGTEMPQKQINHDLTIDMAKEIAMVQRTERGKQARQYFIECEKRLKAIPVLTPEQQMAQGLLAAQKILAEKDQQIISLTADNARQTQIIGELKPKADYTDKILQNKGLVAITAIAKDYGMSGKAMNKKLHELKIIYKMGNQWLLYSDYQSKGYTHSETIPITKSNGMADIVMNTKWTQKGRLFLYDVLKKHNILPMIEQ